MIILIIILVQVLCCYSITKITRNDINGVMFVKKERTYDSIQQTFDTAVRSEAIDCLIHQPEVTKCAVYWRPKHGAAGFFCEKAKHPHGNHRAQNKGQVQHLQFSKEKAAEVVMGGHDYVLPSTLSFPN